MSRFDYVKYDDKAFRTQENFKELFERISISIENCPAKGRAQSLALTKLEEAYMWVGKMIRDEQVQRNGSAELQEERKDG